MWFAVSDDLDSNRKWERLWDITTEAEWCRCVALWTFCGSWCAGAMSDGEVSLERAYKLVKGSRRKVERAADQLVEVGLWEVVPAPKGSPKGSPKRFHFVHHSDHNPTRKQIELRKQKSRQSTEKHRATRRNHSTSDQSRDASQGGHVIGHSRARVTPTPTPIQSSPSARPPFDPPVEPVALPLFGDEQGGARPPPAAAGGSPQKGKGATARCRISDDWQPADSTRSWALDPAGGKEGTGPKLSERELVELVPAFRDHHIAKSGKDSLKTARGWEAAFRTWCRNHRKGYGAPRAGPDRPRAGDAGMAPGTYQQSQPDEDNLPWRQTAI